MISKNYSTIQPQKEIVNQIFKDEQLNHQLEVSFNAVTIKEYYHTDIFKKKLKLKNPVNLFYQLTTPLTSCAWYDQEEKAIIMILDHYQETKDISKTKLLAELMMTVYHELKHRYQLTELTKDNPITYREILIYFEYFIITSNYTFYLNNHDHFMIEIDANQYACKKAQEFIKQNPECYNEIQDYLKKVTKKYQYQEEAYNFQEIFNQFHHHFHQIASTTRLIDVDNHPFLSLFYYSNGTFKSLSEIVNNPKIKSINPQITTLILSSRPFIEQLDFSELTSSEIEYMIWLLETLYQQESKRLLLVTEQTITELKELKRKFLQAQEIFSKLNVLHKMLDDTVQLIVSKIEETSLYSYHNQIPYILQKKLINPKKKRNL